MFLGGEWTAPWSKEWRMGHRDMRGPLQKFTVIAHLLQVGIQKHKQWERQDYRCMGRLGRSKGLLVVANKSDGVFLTCSVPYQLMWLRESRMYARLRLQQDPALSLPMTTSHFFGYKSKMDKALKLQVWGEWGSYLWTVNMRPLSLYLAGFKSSTVSLTHWWCRVLSQKFCKCTIIQVLICDQDVVRRFGNVLLRLWLDKESSKGQFLIPPTQCLHARAHPHMGTVKAISGP